MPQYDGSLIERGFQFGEITPSLWARTDAAAYAHGTKTARNVYIQREGGLTNRPGTLMLAQVKDSAAGRVRLVPFVFSNAVSYVLEFGDKYMRVYRNGTQINANLPLAWNAAVTYVPSDLVSYNGISYYCIALNKNSAPGNASWYALTDSIFEIPTIYSITDIVQMQYVQLRNILYITCSGNGGQNYPVMKLSCGGDTNWVFNAPTFVPSTPAPGSGASTTYATFTDPNLGSPHGNFPWPGSMPGSVYYSNPHGNAGQVTGLYGTLLPGQVMVLNPQEAGTDDAGLPMDVNRYMITAVDAGTGIESFPMQGTYSSWQGTNNSVTMGDGYASPYGASCNPSTIKTAVRFTQLNSQPITALVPGAVLVVEVPSTANFATGDYFQFSGTGNALLDGKTFQGYVSSGAVTFTTINSSSFSSGFKSGATLICLASQITSCRLASVAGNLQTSIGATVTANTNGPLGIGYPGAGPIGAARSPTTGGDIFFPFDLNGWPNATLADINSFFAYGPMTLNWSPPAISGNYVYNIYRMDRNGLWGLIGVSETTSYTDIGIAPNVSEEPSNYTAIGNGDIGNPSVIGAFQQRLLLANTPSNQDWVYCSNAGDFEAFTTTRPVSVESDTVQFEVAGSSYNPVTCLTDNAFLLIFTSTGELSCFGAGNAYAPGPLTPTAIGLTQQGYYGANQALRPITVGKNVLYIQSLQSKVRELIFTYLFQGYVGEDDTVNSEHLFDGYTMIDWCYQQEPNSIVWVVRNDGALLSYTYLPELKLKGWTRHDTLGLFESVCTIPEGTEHALYAAVNRNGVRFIERFNNQTAPFVENQVPLPDGPLVGTYVNKKMPDWHSWVFMDCSQFYDGRNGVASAAGVQGYVGLTIGTGDYSVGGAGFTLNVNPFVDVYLTLAAGQVILWTNPADGATWEFMVLDATNAPLSYLVRPTRLVPTTLAGVESIVFSVAINQVTGLSYLQNGTQVAVLADGSVLSSYATPTWLTVQNGVVNLPGYYGFVRVGLPYLSDVRSLDIDVTDQGMTAKDKPQLINRLACYFKDTRGGWLGTMPPQDDAVMPLENLTPLAPRSGEPMGAPPRTHTGIAIAAVDARFAFGANAFIRQPDPLPMTLTALIPAGKYMLGS